MPAYIDQSVEDFLNQIYIGNLPVDVDAKKITNLFGKFGRIVNVFLRRRIAKDSPILLLNPFVTLAFETQESINQIMANRPYLMDGKELSVHRCLPNTRRYPNERHMITNKILVRIPKENYEEILPDDEMITDYLRAAGGQIVRYERWNERTIFVEFDDYDPVDICCLSRPHSIANQIIEIEKCPNEQQARRRAQVQQNTRSSSFKLSPISMAVDTDNQSGTTISPTLPMNIDGESGQHRFTYHEMTHYFEGEYEQLLSSLQAELEEVTKERIRFERLTHDYRNEEKRLTEENRQWKKLFSESIQEKPRVQSDGESSLRTAKEKYSKMKEHYERLIEDIHQQSN